MARATVLGRHAWGLPLEGVATVRAVAFTRGVTRTIHGSMQTGSENQPQNQPEEIEGKTKDHGVDAVPQGDRKTHAP